SYGCTKLARRAPRRYKKFRLPVRRHQILERHHASVRKRDRLVRDRNRRRNVRVVKRVVEWIAEEGKVTPVVDKAMMKSKAAIKSRTVAVVRIVSRAIRRVSIFHVNPGLARMASHFADGLLLRRTPGEPDRIRRHPRANLPLSHQRLVAWRKRIENIRVLGNPVLQRLATC